PAADQLDANADSVLPTFSLRSQSGAQPLPLNTELELQRDWKPTGAQLDISGELYQPSSGEGVGQATPSCLVCGAALSSADSRCSACDARAAFEKENAPLELAGDPRAHLQGQSVLPEEKRSLWSGRTGAWLKRLTVLAAFGALGFVAYQWVWPMLEARRSRPAGVLVMMRIVSEPWGASILIDGKSIGTTPFFTENIWPPRDIPIRLILRGYRPWTGKFTGAKEEKLKVSLTR
ncbi:MAG: PEGA domain-containing protein, partial [Myxococcaceae bacterium]